MKPERFVEFVFPLIDQLPKLKRSGKGRKGFVK